MCALATAGTKRRWSGVKSRLLADAQANRPISRRLGQQVDEMEVELPARLAVVRTLLEAALAELNR